QFSPLTVRGDLKCSADKRAADNQLNEHAVIFHCFLQSPSSVPSGPTLSAKSSSNSSPVLLDCRARFGMESAGIAECQRHRNGAPTARNMIARGKREARRPWFTARMRTRPERPK